MLWILTSGIVPWVTLPWMHYSSGPVLPLRVTLTQGKSDPVPALRAPHTARASARFLQWSANEQLRGGIRAEEERRKQGNRLPSLRLRSYCGFLNSALQGFPLVFGSFLQPTILVCLLQHTQSHPWTMILPPGTAAVTPEEFSLWHIIWIKPVSWGCQIKRPLWMPPVDMLTYTSCS